jgi:hypothetical protein
MFYGKNEAHPGLKAGGIARNLGVAINSPFIHGLKSRVIFWRRRMKEGKPQEGLILRLAFLRLKFRLLFEPKAYHTIYQLPFSQI